MSGELVLVGQLWKSRRSREVLRIERCWDDPRHAADPATVRGHPVRGGRPLVCPVSYLTANYVLLAEVSR